MLYFLVKQVKLNEEKIMSKDNSRLRTWAEIDLEAIKYNYTSQKDIYGNKARICCVVKANAYGHGATVVSQMLENAGVDFFAVSNIDEAIVLRDAGIISPILVLGYTAPESAKQLSEYNISQCIPSYEYAKDLDEEARSAGVSIKAHFKIDTGMGRLGFVFTHSSIESLSELLRACSFDSLIHEGIFTHFSSSDQSGDGETFTKAQYYRFCEVIEHLNKKGYTFKIRHCSNSASALYDSQYALDMVRVGLLFFGALPSEERRSAFVPRETMTLKTVVANIKTVKAGDPIGYGREYVAPKDMKIATLPIGYADGFLRTNYQNGISLSVSGTPCKVVGRVCMDQCTIDVSEIENISMGDEVIVFGKNGCNSLSDFAKNNRTIPYEILCLVGARVPRVYVGRNN